MKVLFNSFLKIGERQHAIPFSGFFEQDLEALFYDI